MSNEDQTDYQPGDAPVPVDSTVEYEGRDWKVFQHQSPRKSVPEPEVNYPDGVAYALWPVDVPLGLDNGSQMRTQVRRRSFRVKPEN